MNSSRYAAAAGKSNKEKLSGNFFFSVKNLYVQPTREKKRIFTRARAWPEVPAGDWAAAPIYIYTYIHTYIHIHIGRLS
jgi:hypothetical protein